MRTVAVVPHTHWDREWYLPFQVFRLKLVGLLDDLLPALEADPDYAHFLLDGQLAVVDDYLAVRPEAEAALRRLISAGRVAVGPWYTLPDEFLVSGETLVRDLQLGFERAAAVGGAMEVGYLPDMFGHVAQMPQLFRSFGLEHAVVWRGVPDAIESTGFTWSAPDGSSVRAEYLPGGYGNGARLPRDADALVAKVDAFADRNAAMLDGRPVLWMNGTDHLLPQPWLGEVVGKANAVQDRWRLAVTSLPAYLALVAADDEATGRTLPRWTGELRSGARANLLMGVASNRVDVKQAAARAERALEGLAEPLSALFVEPEQWPAALLAEAWLGVVRNAAHDSVCACSADEVVDEVVVRYATARQIGEGLAELAAAAFGPTVAVDEPVVLNPSARMRAGVVELTLPGEGPAPDGTQLLRARPAELTLLDGVDLETAAVIAREASEWGGYTSVRAVDAGDGTARVVATQQARRKVLARVTVPGYGWQAWAEAPLDASPVDVGALVTTVARIRYVDGGDVGDTYNWCPPDGDAPVDLEAGPAEVVEDGPLRARVRVRHSTDGLQLDTVVEARAGERLVRVETTVDNRRRDHRLRAHLALPRPADHSEAECAFAVVTRGLTAEGGPSEVGLPTFPSRRFVRAGGLTVVHEGLLEYELAGIGDDGRATELALTLLRCTGMLSQVPMATRPLPAGPFHPLEGPQLQRQLVLRWGFVDGDDVDPYAAVDDAFLPMLVTNGGGDEGRRPRSGTLLDVRGAEVSALRRTPAGAVEVRVFNPTPQPATVSLPGRRGWRTDLRGRPLDSFEATVALGPWEIATLVLGAAAGT